MNFGVHIVDRHDARTNLTNPIDIYSSKGITKEVNATRNEVDLFTSLLRLKCKFIIYTYNTS